MMMQSHRLKEKGWKQLKNPVVEEVAAVVVIKTIEASTKP
jgi:hypothetical protein